MKPAETVLRPGTGAATALRVLHALAGQADIDTWRDALRRECIAMARKIEDAAQKLIEAGMIFRRGRLYIVSDDGLRWLGVRVGIVPRAELLAVPARHVPLRKRSWANLAREGSLDYQDIPSRFGESLISHRKA